MCEPSGRPSRTVWEQDWHPDQQPGDGRKRDVETDTEHRDGDGARFIATDGSCCRRRRVGSATARIKR